MMNRWLCGAMSLLMLGALATVVVWSMGQARASAHCQVPCGIYDDAARIAGLYEDAATIAKAVNKINDLAAARDARSLNQATRWIVTKENHASHIIEVVAEYFLTQKVKPVSPGAVGYDAYLKKLADHHRVMVAAMKAKQNVDADLADALHRAIDAVAATYKG